MSEFRFLSVLKGDTLDPPPVWLMRQAGRYLPEYRETRAKAGGFLALCLTPDLAIEATLQPIRRYGFDAAILFSDLPLLAYGMGRSLDYREGEGPVLEPITGIAQIDALDLDSIPTKLAPVYETVAGVRARLPAETALIGFAGAPWTLACYMVQGRGGHEFVVARRFAFADPERFDHLIDRLTTATIGYLDAQVRAGAQAVQLFDSWAGLLPETAFRRWCVEPVRRIIAGLKAKHPDLPVIAFPRGAGPLLQGFVAATGADAVQIDASIPLDWAAHWVQQQACVQGNLDPQLLVVGGDVMRREIRRIRRALAGGPHVFNLGHGIVPEVPPQHVDDLVAAVREPL